MADWHIVDHSVVPARRQDTVVCKELASVVDDDSAASLDSASAVHLSSPLR